MVLVNMDSVDSRESRRGTSSGSSFWDYAYEVGITPWDVGYPPTELVSLVESGFLRPCRSLDVGCGTGSLVIYLAEKGFDAYGLDISRVAIDKALEKAVSRGVSPNFYVADFTNVGEVIGLDLGEFELVTDVGCFHSIRPGLDRVKYRDSLNHVLRVGGYFLLWCFEKGNYNWGPPGVGANEVESIFGSSYDVVVKRSSSISSRRMFFYILVRSK